MPNAIGTADGQLTVCSGKWELARSARLSAYSCKHEHNSRAGTIMSADTW